MTDYKPAKTLADLAAEQGVRPVVDPDELAAKEPLSDAEWNAWQAAMGRDGGSQCPNCLDAGYVCDEHPDRPWEGMTGPHPAACGCSCGAPCPTCCEPVAQDGSHDIGSAFIPRRR